MASLAPVGAQPDPRCDVHGPQEVGGTLNCLDLDALDGKSVTLPANVTRIQKDGFTLCKGDVIEGGDVDIVYIVDHSGSMGMVEFPWVRSNGSVGDTLKFPASKVKSSTNHLGGVQLVGNDTNFIAYMDGSTNHCGTSYYDSSKYWSGYITIPWHERHVRLPLLRPELDISECFSPGDPFSQRYRAVSTAIETQSVLAPGSRAGFIAFKHGRSLVSEHSPVSLNDPGSLGALLSMVNGTIEKEMGGTRYTTALQRAQDWLKSSKNKKAVIFISDGVPKIPSDDNPSDYWAVLNNNFPPMYTIFLGDDPNFHGVDTLKKFASHTGGDFHFIPHNRPDSLGTVIANIQNVLFKSFVGRNAQVTNRTQSITASSPSMTYQQDGSWLMDLQKVVPLAPGSNEIEVSAVFRDTVAGTDTTLKATFTLNVSGPVEGTTGYSPVGTDIGVSCFPPSSLSLLDSAGNQVPYFTEKAVKYQMRLEAIPAGMQDPVAGAATPVLGDIESVLALGSAEGSSGEYRIYRNNFGLKIQSTAQIQNGWTEGATFDTLMASWTHPNDPRDTARALKPIRPSNQPIQIVFTDSTWQPIGTYPSHQKSVFLQIQDQPLGPGETAVARIYATASNFQGLGGLDSLVLVLDAAHRVGPGLYRFEIPLGKVDPSVTPKNVQDDSLQVSTQGDLLRAVYTDPFFGDSKEANAGFHTSVEIAAALEFVTSLDTNAAPVTGIWPADAGKLYLRYEDDYASGAVPTKTVSLEIGNFRYEVELHRDSEQPVVSLVAGSNVTFRALYLGEIDLRDVAFPVPKNGTAEVYYLSRVKASIASHSNLGAPDGGTATASLEVAYPNKPAFLNWEQQPAAAETKRNLALTLFDQSYSSLIDTALVRARCLRSDDVIEALPLLESGASSGEYAGSPLGLEEGAAVVDDILQCLDGDRVEVTYIDPVYGDTTMLSIPMVGKPRATPPSQEFVTSVRISLGSPTAGARIHYTLDGSTPDTTDALYNSPLDITATTTLKAIAVRPGFLNSGVMSETYTKESRPSSLAILDPLGNPLGPKQYLSEQSGSFGVRVLTTYASLSSLEPIAYALGQGSRDTLLLTNRLDRLTEIQFDGNHPLAVEGMAVSGLLTRAYDWIVVEWRNPLLTSDFVSDTARIRPQPRQAQVSFTDAPAGQPVFTYPSGTTRLFVTVQDQIPHPDSSYSIMVTTIPYQAGQKPDTLHINLSKHSPGILAGEIPVGGGYPANTADALLQVVEGDQVRALYVDPVDGDADEAAAGFAAAVEIPGVVRFTDSLWIALPDQAGVHWDPSLGRVFVEYQDDYYPSRQSIVTSITLASEDNRGGTWLDMESITLTLGDSAGGKGIWRGELPLADAAIPTASNGTLESRFIGKARISLASHRSDGSPSDSVEDALTVAVPDRAAQLILTDGNHAPVTRASGFVHLRLEEQDFSQGLDTLEAELSCLQSGDAETGILLVEVSPGIYETRLVSKNEDPAVSGDGVLSCNINDEIVARYIDPVYGTPAEARVLLRDQRSLEIYFASVLDSSRILELHENQAGRFLAIVEWRSPRVDKVDTLQVQLTTAAGESETWSLVETAVNSGKFVSEVAFFFQVAPVTTSNGRLEIAIDPEQSANSALVTGRSLVPGAPDEAEIQLWSRFVQASSARIRDGDGDGRGDTIVVSFPTALPRAPESVDTAYWNQVLPVHLRTAPRITLGAGSTSVILDYSDEPFELGMTDIPAGAKPHLVLPSDGLFGGKRVPIEDGIGPVLLRAVKVPSRLSLDPDVEKPRFLPDTLVLTLSEPLLPTGTAATWNGLVRFSRSCSDRTQGRDLIMTSRPLVSADGLTWTVYVDNNVASASPLVNDCIFLNAQADYADAHGNPPGSRGVVVEGSDGPRLVQLLQAYPPVAGMTQNDVAFRVANTMTSQEGYTFAPTGSLRWIPPVGWTEGQPFQPFVPGSANELSQGQDYTAPVNLPQGISAVQVITTAPYVAHVLIYDHLGNYVRRMTQAFGFQGELDNPERFVPKGRVSYLVWDLKDKDGREVGNGAYVWRIILDFPNAPRAESFLVRTGYIRR